MYDVAIVGAGPAGSYAAYLLAKEGLNVVLLDRNAVIEKDKVCTGIVSKEAFKRFSLPIDTILRDINSVRVISPSGDSFKYLHHSAFAYVVDRNVFDRSLLRKALKEGVNFLSKSLVEELQIKKDYVELFYSNYDWVKSRVYSKQRESIRARVSVIATGGLNLTLLKKAGLKDVNDFFIGAQVETDLDGLDEVEIYLGNNIAPGSFTWVVPLGNGRARIGLSMKGNATSYLKNFLRMPFIKERLREEKPEIKSRPIPFGFSRKTYGFRILSVGDAAGQVKTTTGGGIYYGLIGAEIAAKTIQQALKKGILTPFSLKVYEEKWLERLGSEINTGIWLRRIYSTLSDKKINQLINIANNDGIVPVIKRKALFDWQKDFFLSLLSKPIIKHLLDENVER